MHRLETWLGTILTLIAIAACAPLVPSNNDAGNRATALSAFVVAHPDDWQLFMGDVAVAHVGTKRPVVFVYLTAGGADYPSEYWRVREAGAAASLYAAASLDGSDMAEGRRATCGDVVVLAHRVHRCSFRNTVSYHLRLPDGGYNGTGFAATAFQSLARLRTAEILRVEAVDASTVYRGWDDLRATLHSIVAIESKYPPNARVEFHTHDSDGMKNPGDHADHFATGQLAEEVASQLGSPVVRYAGYDIANRPANLPVKAAMAKMLVFMTYDRQRLLANAQWSAYAEQPAAYSSWLFRTYSRPAGGLSQ
jgi:LmbE family N-acetylglucosaminyl deacetylase